jgi:hypothetical protein
MLYSSPWGYLVISVSFVTSLSLFNVYEFLIEKLISHRNMGSFLDL